MCENDSQCTNGSKVVLSWLQALKKTVAATKTSGESVRKILQEKINCDGLVDSVSPMKEGKTALETMSTWQQTSLRRLVRNY